jgi:phospholipid/cholesterol/gamma-HCH transport system substrate-binding protein
METRANYALIGLFTLLVVAAGFFFVYWFAVSETGQARREIRIVFEGSVAGLSRGSAVNFNGLRVGEVAQLRIDLEDPGKVIGRIVIDATTPVRADTRARLEYQGLTGIAQVSLTGGSPAAPLLRAEEDEPAPTIIAEPSDFQDLIESARDIARATAETLERINLLVDDNDDTITATVRNVEQFSRALSDNAPAIDSFLSQVGQAAERVGPLADSLDELSRNMNTIVASVDPEAVAGTVRNVESFTQTLADSRDALNQIFADTGALTQRLNETSIKLESTLDDVSLAVRAVDADRINATIANVENFSQTLAENRDNITNVLTGAATLTENLSATSARIDTAIEEVGRLVAAVDPDTIAATLGNVESFTQTLADSRDAVGQILADATTLTQQLSQTSVKLDATLDDVGAAVRAVDADRINNTIANVESFSQALAENRENIDSVIAGAATLTQNLNATSLRVDAAIADVSRVLSAVDDEQLAATLASVQAFSQTLSDGRENVAGILRDVSGVAQSIDPAKIANAIDSAERFAIALGDSSAETQRVIANAARLTESLTATSTRIDAVLADVSGVVSAIDDEQLAATLANVEAFSRTLSDSRQNVTDFLQGASDAARAVDPAKIASTVDGVERFAAALGGSGMNFEQFIASAAEVTENLTGTVTGINQVLADVSGVVSAVDDQQLAATLANVEAFSRTLSDNRESVATIINDVSGVVQAIDPARIAKAIESAEQFARALGDSSADTEQVIANAVSLTAKLNESADRIDGVLQAAQDFLGTATDEVGNGIFDDIREAAVAIRVLADNLDQRTGEITTGINRFTGPGLQEYRALADDGRRTLEEISRAVRSLERNPQQLLFGGQPSVPEYRERR